jgi:DNA replication licensing factor MCM4
MDIPTSDDVEMAAGTPKRAQAPSGPSRPGTVARRALGMSSGDGHVHFLVIILKLLYYTVSATPVRQSGAGSNEPLFLPSSPIVETPRPSRRGDIHSNALFSTPLQRQQQARLHQPSSQRTGIPSSGPMLLPSSQPPQSRHDVNSINSTPSETEDLSRVIWGTNVSLSESMASFSNFLRSFKVKYRVSFDRDRGFIVPAMASPQEGERLLYEDLLRKMRITGQTNLNLDMVNLHAFPPTRKLHSQLIKYPQEIIPVMDQVLKDLMIAIAEEDAANGIEGMVGDEGEDEINDLMGRVYKIRPWGGDASNMRDLNPTGQY